jgi:uncharacterized coiled-coil protein SlyX
LESNKKEVTPITPSQINPPLHVLPPTATTTLQQSNDDLKEKLATQEQLLQGLQNQLKEQQKQLLSFLERLEPHIPQITEKEKK